MSTITNKQQTAIAEKLEGMHLPSGGHANFQKAKTLALDAPKKGQPWPHAELV
jgi:hypothetical protein